MGHTNYKNDYSAFVAPYHRSETGHFVQDEEQSEHRPRNWKRVTVRISWVLFAAFFVSLAGHSLFLGAIAATPGTAHDIVWTESHAVPRFVHLDLDLTLPAETGSVAAPEQEPEPSPTQDTAVPAAAVEVRQETRTPRPPKETIQETEAPKPQERTPTPPVDSLVENNDATDILERNRPHTPNAAIHNALASNAAGSIGAGTTQNGRIGVGANHAQHRAKGGTGDGSSQDIDGLRKHHIGHLNRSIRKRNPCTRKLSHLGLSGDVVLGLTQRADGTVDKVRVLRSSGEPLIDDAAQSFMREQADLPRPDNALMGDVWKIGLRFQCGS